MSEGSGDILVAKGTFSITINGTPRMFRRGETLIEDTHPWFKGPLASVRDQFGPVRDNLTYVAPAAAAAAPAKTPAPAAPEKPADPPAAKVEEQKPEKTETAPPAKESTPKPPARARRPQRGRSR